MVGFLRTLAFWSKRAAGSDRAKRLLDKGLDAVESYTESGVIQNEAVSANTVKELVSALEGVDVGVIHVNRCLVIKSVDLASDRKAVFVRRLSQREAEFLESNPGALDPATLLRTLDEIDKPNDPPGVTRLN